MYKIKNLIFMTVASLWPLHGIGMKDFKGGMGTFERGMAALG
jgi:hypothetical protein